MPNDKRQVANVSAIARELARAKDPPAVVDIEAKLDSIERYMRKAGLYNTNEIRPVNEAKMRARWRLGQLLAAVERGAGPGRGKKNQTLPKSFGAYIRSIGISKDVVQAAQRIGTLPAAELEDALADARRHDILSTFDELIDRARPYWFKARREKKHRDIKQAAKTVERDAPGPFLGPFPLIYADPPWKFEVYSAKGLERTPDQHYPTLSDAEICLFTVGGLHVRDLAHRDAALLLWCTSGNIHRALEVLASWGFTYKAQAVWVKDRLGMGLVFRNKHEVLLYGTRGKMPGPQYQPPSVFEYPRGRHSAKPPEIRKEIERMYPNFDARRRLELFSREPKQPDGWTHAGFEAGV